MEDLVADKHIPVLIPPDSGLRKGKDPRPGWDKGLYAFMRRVIDSDNGKAIYRRRMATASPVLKSALSQSWGGGAAGM